MPADKYDGDDAEAIKAKAIALIERQFPGQEIMDIAICCDWDIEDYEHWVERAGDWIKERVHYREIQIGVLMPLNEERAVIRVVGIRQYYSSGKELVDVIRELPMLRKMYKSPVDNITTAWCACYKSETTKVSSDLGLATCGAYLRTLYESL